MRSLGDAKGKTIYAQIDVDSHDLDAFDPITVNEVEIVADCLAGAYARQDRSTRRRRARG